MWLVELIVEGVLEWTFQRGNQWVWIPIGLVIVVIGVIVFSSSRVGGALIASVGLLAIGWGIWGGVFRRGDE